METQICKECNIELDLSNYSIKSNPNSKNHYNVAKKIVYSKVCKNCTSIWARNFRKLNKEPSNIFRVCKEDKLLLSLIRARISEAKTRVRAMNRDMEVSISDEYMYNLFKKQNGLCALSGLEMIPEKHNYKTLSIDRIDSSKPYIESNVQWVIWGANRAKGDLSYENFINLCENIVRMSRDYRKESIKY